MTDTAKTQSEKDVEKLRATIAEQVVKTRALIARWASSHSLTEEEQAELVDMVTGGDLTIHAHDLHMLNKGT